ncbi:MAG: hypothetical protein ABIQ27_06390 [Flavobacterium sp.]|uniref:hypothetical protein n=1 Tax=Flavobacterium sp. TaxID=239 RepID=UPI003267B886
MKKQLIIIMLFVITVSCTTIKQISNQKIESRTDCSSYNLVDNKILYSAKIDGVEQIFHFDTGANMSVLTDSTITDLSQKKIGSLGTARLSNDKKVKLKTVTAKLESELFYSENKVFAYIEAPKSRCTPNIGFKGILGIDVFFQNDNPLHLDFNNSKICNISLSKKEELLKNGYAVVKSECESKQIFVYITVDTHEYKFKLDTGFFGSLVFPSSDKSNFSKYNSVSFEGSLFRTAANKTVGEDSIFENVPISISNLELSTNIIESSSLGDNYLMGYGFLKGFDWIIDYKNNKIYIKRNSNQFTTKISNDIFNYVAFDQNDKLFVIAKQKKLTKYNLGDQIISVNEKQVTTENICEIQDLLNKTQNWDSLKLEVIPKSK